ncbi:hypothetical protein MKEN_00610500 [Mycena kentingensis (nom. inval.)]|nr:hypothetical protein MKEN_00610500 [Mycena kentingensis (nom. inval.)]
MILKEPPLVNIPPPRKRSSLGSFLRFIFTTLLRLFLAYVLIGVIGQALWHWTTFSHRGVYQNQTLEDIAPRNRHFILQPLIGKKDKFDLAVSIWSLPLDSNEGPAARPVDVAETAIYSDIVLRDLTLSSTHAKATLKYQLPVHIFRKLLLKENDLRASFVLIPQPDSLADRITNFSSWLPEGMVVPAVRAWPFPLGSPPSEPPSVVDRALDSFGISMPLIEFREYRKAACKAEETGSDNSDEEDGEAPWSLEDDPEGDRDRSPGPFRESTISDIEKHPAHAVDRHPFVVTRTQIRIVDETHIFNRKAYNKEHNRLKANSCGQNRATKPDYLLCDRFYMRNGNWETRLELSAPENRTEWAYAPYLGYGAFSSGPKDIVPIPVTRKNCSDDTLNSANDPGKLAQLKH